MIESLPLILKDFPKATLDIVGGGSLEKKLKEQVDNLGSEENVKFHGKVAQSKVIELMKQAHVFCFPTSASEGFPKVVIEALACGLPVITTKVSVLPQLIGNGCGVLLDKPTSENVAEAIRNIFSDDGNLQQLFKQCDKYGTNNIRLKVGGILSAKICGTLGMFITFFGLIL